MRKQNRAGLIKESGFLVLLLIFIGGCSWLPETSTLRYKCHDIRHEIVDGKWEREWWCKKDQMYFQCAIIDGEPNGEETQEEGSTEAGEDSSSTE
jgi:hypothetical protein